MKKKILLVDDTSGKLESNGNKLRNAGFDVKNAGSTGQADASIKKDAVTGKERPRDFFDIIITDLNMNNGSKELDSYRDKTIKGSITGWIWLYYVCILPQKIDPTWIIVYSEFENELESYMNEIYDFKPTEEEKEYYNKHVNNITDRPRGGKTTFLVDKVNEIIKNGKKAK